MVSLANSQETVTAKCRKDTAACWTIRFLGACDRCAPNSGQSAAARFRILHELFLEEDHIMPDDKTLATILAICDLIKHDVSGVESAVEAYQRAMKDVMD